MKQVLQHVRGRRLEIADVPEPSLKGGGVLVRNAASLISAGTEKMVIDFAGKSLLGKAQDRPDLVSQVLQKVRKEGIGPTVQTVMSRLDQPIPLGYSSAGVVEEVGRGAEELAVGERVACAGQGYASHAGTIFVPKNLTVRIPEGVAFEDAAYVTLGAIALQGVRIADMRIGESVAVIGLGLLGQLTVQMLSASGCRVFGVDTDPLKVAQAIELGAEAALVRTDDVEGAVAAFTRGVGIDAVVIAAATESNDPVELAGRLCRDRGRISMVGAVRMEIPRKVYYEKELELRMSRSYGPGRYDPAYEEEGRDYPISYVRWTERRNMEEFLRLVAVGAVTPSRLTTHRFPVEKAEDAYALVTGSVKEPFGGIVLSYPTRDAEPRLQHLPLRPAGRPSGALGIGCIGAGNFARAALLPRLAAEKGARLVGLATATGANSATTGRKFGFGYASTDADALIADPEVEAVVIATRHGSHASFAARALRAGKAVFVEKPLAIDPEGLAAVLEAQASTGALLMVGFNRRFSPLAVRVRSAFAPGTPLAIQYRINSGPIPRGTWVHDPDDGGGRIVGEVCHFVDLVQFLTGELPIEVFAHGLGGPEGELHDVLTISLRFERGSIASISYFSNGDRSYPKERVEVYGGGTLAVIDDFRGAEIVTGGKRTKIRKLSQEKGYSEEITAFVEAVRTDGPAPIDLESLVATTRATFAIETSLRTGAPVPIG